MSKEDEPQGEEEALKYQAYLFRVSTKNEETGEVIEQERPTIVKGWVVITGEKKLHLEIDPDEHPYLEGQVVGFRDILVKYNAEVDNNARN